MNLQLFTHKLIKWLQEKCADWFFDNIMTWSYCLHRRYSLFKEKKRILINEHALNRETFHLKRGFPNAGFNLMQYQAIEITFKDQLKTLQLYKEKTSKSLVLRYFYWQPCCTPWLFLFKALYLKFAVSIIRISNRG